MEEFKSIKQIKEFWKKYDADNIVFSDYCCRRMNKRGIEAFQVKDVLLKPDSLFYVEKQLVLIRTKNTKELRYKLIFKISNKYNLIVIITEEANILKVVNVIKTSRKVKREWEKRILR